MSKRARPKITPKTRGTTKEEKAWEQTEHVPGEAEAATAPAKRGRPPKKDALRRTGKPLQVYLPADLHKRVKLAALRQEVTVSELVAQALESAIAAE